MVFEFVQFIAFTLNKIAMRIACATTHWSRVRPPNPQCSHFMCPTALHSAHVLTICISKSPEIFDKTYVRACACASVCVCVCVCSVFGVLKMDDDINFNRIEFLILQIICVNVIAILTAVHTCIAYRFCRTFS